MYMPPREEVPAAVEAEGRPRLRTRRRSMRMARQRRKQSFSSTSSNNPNDNNNNNNNNGMAGPSNTNKNHNNTSYSQSQNTPQQHYHNHHTHSHQMPHQHQHQQQQHQQQQQHAQHVQHSQQQHAQHSQQQHTQGRGGQRHIKNADRTRVRSPSPKHTPPPTPPSPSKSHKSQSQQSHYQHSGSQQHQDHPQYNPSTPSPISLVINLGNDLLATRQEVDDLKKKQKQSGNICSWSTITRVMVLLSSVAVSLFVSKALGVTYNLPGQNPFFTDQNGPDNTGGPLPGQGQQFQGAQGQGFQSGGQTGFNAGGQRGQQWSGCQDPSFKRIQKPDGGYTCVKKSVSEHCSGYYDNQGGQKVWKCCPPGQSYQYDENAQKGACCQDHDTLSVDRMNGNKVSCCPQGTQYQFKQQIGKGSCCGYGHAFSVDPNTRTGFCCPITHYWDGNTCRVGQNPNAAQGGDSMMTGQFMQGQQGGSASVYGQQMNEQNMHAHAGHGMHHQSGYESGSFGSGAQGAGVQGTGAQGMGMFEAGAQGSGLYGTGMEGNMQDGARMGMGGNVQSNLQGNVQGNIQEGIPGGMLQGRQENLNGQGSSGNFGQEEQQQQQQQFGTGQQRFGKTDPRGQYPDKSGNYPDNTGSYYRGYRHWREDTPPVDSWCRARKVCPKNCNDLGLKYGHCYTITYPDGQALNRAANGEYHKGADYIDDITFRVCDTSKSCAYTNKPVTRSDGFILRDEKGVPLKDAKGWVYSLSYAAHFNFMADEEATAANVKVATEVAIGIVPFVGKPSCMGDGCSICLNTLIKRSRGVGPVCPVEGNKMPAFGTLINPNMCQRFIFHEVRCDDQPCPNTRAQNTGRARGGRPQQQQQQQRQVQFDGQQHQQGGYPSGQANYN